MRRCSSASPSASPARRVWPRRDRMGSRRHSVAGAQGFASPSALGLMSRQVGGSEQGRLQGANASIMGIANLLGRDCSERWRYHRRRRLALPGRHSCRTDPGARHRRRLVVNPTRRTSHRRDLLPSIYRINAGGSAFAHDHASSPRCLRGPRLGPKRQDEPCVLEQYAETAGWPKRPIGDWGRQPMLQMSSAVSKSGRRPPRIAAVLVFRGARIAGNARRSRGCRLRCRAEQCIE
jgi:hypothetical protein